MHLKINISCDFKISKYCKGSYCTDKYNYINNTKRNNGKFRCKFCAIEETHKGQKSHYFKYLKNEDYFDLINSDEKAYLLGVIAGDGHIRDNMFNLVANSKDIETINKLIKVIYKNKPPKLTKNGNCYAINITSEKLAQNLQKHLNVSAGKKSDKISLPNLTDDLIWSFIRGFFDTDGSITNITSKQTYPSCFCSSTSFVILSQIKTLCLSHDIKCNITGIKLKFNGKNALKFLSKIYNIENSMHLTRKYEMFKLWETWEPRKGCNVKKIKTVSKKRKLSDDALLLIRSNLLTDKELAKMFNVSAATINSAKLGKTYKFLNSERTNRLNE